MNFLTVKAQYPLPQVKALVNRPRNVTLELDICWEYSNVRVKDGGQGKRSLQDKLRALRTNIPHHQQVVHQVPDKLDRHNLFPNQRNVHLKAQGIEDLGLVTSRGRIRMNHVKRVKEEGTRLKTLKKLKGSLMSLTSRRRRTPPPKGSRREAVDMLKKRHEEERPLGGNKKKEAFDMLKRCIRNESVLLVPELEEPFELEEDAPQFAVGTTKNELGS